MMKTSTTSRSGISLLEVLISMFVLMIGLLGVASLLPVGQVQVVEGIKTDRAGAVGKAAFRDIKVRGLLNPRHWSTADGKSAYGNIDGQSPPADQTEFGFSNHDGSFELSYQMNPTTNVDMMPAYVIDPIGVGDSSVIRPLMRSFPASVTSSAWALPRLTYWYDYPTAMRPATWPAPPWATGITDPKVRWLMGDAAYRCTDDSLFEKPKSGDLPATQTFSAGTNPRRQFTGDYTWLMTVVPDELVVVPPASLAGAPASEWRTPYKVSVVVFYKRDMTGNTNPSLHYTGERVYAVDFGPGIPSAGTGLGGGEVVLRGVNAKDPLRAGQWIMLAGKYHDLREATPGTPYTAGPERRKYSWYRVASTSRPTERTAGSGVYDMAVSLVGSDWVANDNWSDVSSTNDSDANMFPLRKYVNETDSNTQAWLFDGAIAVYEKSMRLDW